MISARVGIRVIAYTPCRSWVRGVYGICLYYVIIGFSIAMVLSTTTNTTHILIPITHQTRTLIAPFLLHV
jgi:hypothetical protein